MKPLVSVLLLSYQQKSFLKELIESVLAQSYRPLEIIVTDDASTDGTREMLEEYASKFPGIFTFAVSPTNKGITANCNQGLALCKGDLIALSGGDDIFLPRKIEKQVEVFSTHPHCVLCYTNAEIFDNVSGRVIALKHSRGNNPMRRGRVEDVLFTTGYFVSSTAMFRRTAVPEGGFDERVPMVTDWLFWIEVAQHGTIEFVPEVLVRYRVHPKNISKPSERYLAEQLLAVGIAESKYPSVSSFTNGFRAEVFYNHALGLVESRQFNEASKFLRQARQNGIFNTPSGKRPAAWILYTLLFLGSLRFAPRALTLLRSLKR